MRISQEVFRRTLATFATGVTVVTFRSNGSAHGLTVSAFTSVSLEPPLILVCIKNGRDSHALLEQARHFAVNILSEGQQELAMRFANPNLSSEERFRDAELRTEERAPVFTRNLSHLVCRIANRYDGGDHVICLGEVEDAGMSDETKPLLYHRGAYLSLP